MLLAMRSASHPIMTAAELDLDLDVFAGPFDLLMTVVLREEVALAEVELGEIVIAYLEHVEEQGDLDLEAATEFLVLIASLLELKSRLLLPAPEEEQIELGPEEAAEELLARMLEYRRYRDAAAHLVELFADGHRYLYRAAPLPPELRRVALDAARPAYEADAARGGDRRPPAHPAAARHQPHPPDRLARASPARPARAARRAPGARLRRGFGSEDRLTQAVTLFALLELHKRGEATWEQERGLRRDRSARSRRPGGGRRGDMSCARADRRVAALPLARAGEHGRARRGLRRDRGRGRPRDRPARRRRWPGAASSCARSRAATRSPPIPMPSRRRGGCWRGRRRRR